IADWSQQPLEELLDAETREILSREMDLLPENEREVFVLRDIMEQSNEHVAKELGITIAAVKSRLHRARVHLRDRVNRYFRDKLTRKPRSCTVSASTARTPGCRAPAPRGTQRTRRTPCAAAYRAAAG